MRPTFVPGSWIYNPHMATIDNLQYPWNDPDYPAGSPATSCFSFSHCTRTPFSWMEELEKAAIAIVESTAKPIWICSSGGVDSETVCEIFLKLKLPFKVLTVELVGGKNAHDAVYAKRWCRQNKVEQKIHVLDLQDFVNHELDEYIRDGYIAGELFRYMMVKHMSIVEEMGGFAILAGGEQLYNVDASKKILTAADPYLNVDITYTTPVEWCRRKTLQHEPFFFFSTPEIMLAWLRIPLVDFVLKNPDFFRHPTNRHALKNCVIRYHFPQQQWRNKYTGYENVPELRDMVQKKLQNHFGQRLQKSRLYVSELIRQLQPANECAGAGKKSLLKRLGFS